MYVIYLIFTDNAPHIAV